MPKPFVVSRADRARPLNVVGEKITILASKDRTEGYEVFFQDGVAGTGPPPHSHDWDESFYVLKGNIAFGFEGREMRAAPGTLVHIPAGTEHWFRFESDEGEMLSITGSGSGAAGFFTQVDADVADASDIPGLFAVAANHRLKISAPEQ